MKVAQQSEDQEQYKQLLENLNKSFPNIEVITLKDLVKSIVLSPSVRSGDKSKLDESAKY